MVKLNSEVREQMEKLSFPTGVGSGKTQADMSALAVRLNEWMLEHDLKPYTRVTYLTRMRRYLESVGVEKELVTAARVPQLTISANSESQKRAIQKGEDGVDVSGVMPLSMARSLMAKLCRHKSPFTPVGVADSDVVRMLAVLQTALCARVSELKTLKLSEVDGELYVTGVSKKKKGSDEHFRLVSFASDTQIKSAMAKWDEFSPESKAKVMTDVKYARVVKQIFGHPTHILRKVGSNLAVETHCKSGTPLESFIVRKTALRHAGGIPVTLAHYGNMVVDHTEEKVASSDEDTLSSADEVSAGEAGVVPDAQIEHA